MALLIGLAVLGLCVGSFLNVAIWRVPRRRSVVRPGSHCTSCRTPLRRRDLVPVLSWIALRGRCHCCHAAVSVRYPAVELLTAALFVAMGARFGASWILPAYLVFVASAIGLAFIDIDTLTLPRSIVYLAGLAGAALFAVASATAGEPHRLVDAALGGLGAAAFVWLLHLIAPNGMGFGDVRLAGVTGLYLGWLGLIQVPTGLFLAFGLGAVVGLAWTVRGRVTRTTPIPFGPFLVVGAVATVMWGQTLSGLWVRA